MTPDVAAFIGTCDVANWLAACATPDTKDLSSKELRSNCLIGSVHLDTAQLILGQLLD